VTPDDDLPAPRPAADLTDDERVAVANPTFDVTPAALVDAVATERGVLDATAIGEVGDEHRARRDWRT
jgi:methylthioribose-1-phosphate isomerase